LTTLFTIGQSWFNRPGLYEQLLFASQGDAIVLLQDAVLALQSPIALASFLGKCHASGIAVYALAEDCQLRGIENAYPEVVDLNYQGLVELVIKYEKQVAW